MTLLWSVMQIFINDTFLFITPSATIEEFILGGFLGGH